MPPPSVSSSPDHSHRCMRRTGRRHRVPAWRSRVSRFDHFDPAVEMVGEALHRAQIGRDLGKVADGSRQRRVHVEVLTTKAALPVAVVEFDSSQEPCHPLIVCRAPIGAQWHFAGGDRVFGPCQRRIGSGIPG